MPSKPSKDFVSRTLIDTLKSLLNDVDVDQAQEPSMKRFKGTSDIT